MADKNEGTDDGLEGCSDWYIITEADCKDDDSIDKYFEESDNESLCTDLVDDAAVEQGNSLELFQRQEFQTGHDQILQLKRKFNVRSPEQAPKPAADVASLSPQLEKIAITPKKKKVKKILFRGEPEDSGVVTHEADDTTQELQVETTVLQDSVCLTSALAQSTPFSHVLPAAADSDDDNINNNGPDGGEDANNNDQLVPLTGRDAVQVLMKTLNVRATILAKFKLCFNVSFNDLTRSYRSNKTVSKDWVLAIYGVSDDNVKHAQELLHPQCDFVYFDVGHAGCAVALLELKNQKSRDTVLKLLKTVMAVNELQVLAEPPRTASTPSALFWYKRCTLNDATCFGTLPLWVMRQCSLQHKQEKPFDLTEMVQWAYDNHYDDEANIAYNYALEADVSDNAKAFLRSPSQAKIVRDVTTMVKHYRRAEMRNMSVSEWINYRCKSFKEEGCEDDWKHIAHFLRFQGIPLYRFIGAMQRFLQNIPKKSCLVFYGPPDTGKSFFAMSLISFLGGKVITFANYQSHFWLSPLTDAKFGLLDDATLKCWEYFDMFLRGALDGNLVSLDSKHRNPIQMKFPPMLVTSNVDVPKVDSLKYLFSRLQFFNFPERLPIQTSGDPRYLLTERSWYSFFKRFWVTLALTEQEDEDDGPAGSLRLHTGSNTGTV